MKYYRFYISEGVFDYARTDTKDRGRAEYFDDETGTWVESDTLYVDISSDGSWMPCPEADVLRATAATASRAG